MNKLLKKTIKWSLSILTVWFVAAFVGLVLYLFVIIPWQVENGYNWEGAANKYDNAMQNGDSKAAIYWAKRAAIYDDSTMWDSVYESLGRAYELDKQYEVAVLCYKLSKVERLGRLEEGSESRIYPSQEDKERAFINYTEITNRFAYDKDDKKERYRNLIMYFPFYAPFKNYDDYLRFMEDEYQKLGCPEEYREAMEKLRQL